MSPTTAGGLVLEGLSKRYGRLQVLDGVSAVIHPGRITALVGPNGSGKSTLNKILIGHVHPDGGTATFGGRSLLDGPAARSSVGYMPQLPRFPEQLSGRDLLTLIRDLHGARPVEQAVLDALEIAAILPQPLGTLSGGQRQRINAALALLFAPALAILDEPTAGLDPASAQRFKALVRDLRARGCTVVITSHVVAELESLADDVLLLLDGRAHYAGPIDQLRADAGADSLESAIARLMRPHTPAAA